MIGVTWASLLARFRNRLSETGTEFFDDVMALSFANEAQDAISARVPYTVKTAWATTTIPYRSEYLLDDNLVHPTGALVRRSGGQLMRMNFVEKDVLDGAKSWGLSARVPTRALEVYVEGHKRPTPLALSTDYTDIPASIVGTVVDHMEMLAKAADEENTEYQLARERFEKSLDALQYSQLRTQWDQYERTRPQRMISRPPFSPFWCAYRQGEEGVSIEIWGVS